MPRLESFRARYRALAEHPGALRLIALSLPMRMPLGTLGLGTLLHLRELTGSIAFAGTAVGVQLVMWMMVVVRMVVIVGMIVLMAMVVTMVVIMAVAVAVAVAVPMLMIVDMTVPVIVGIGMPGLVRVGTHVITRRIVAERQLRAGLKVHQPGFGPGATSAGRAHQGASSRI